MPKSIIQNLVSRFINALVAGDLPGIMSCYDDEVVYQMPGVSLIIGKQGVEAHYRNVIAMRVSAASMVADSYVERADCVIEAGTYEMTLNPDGGSAITDKGKYLVVYRQKDGQWRIWYDAVHSDMFATVGSV